jgi:ubiquinone/menaquinone biosynthesis C-methylase UbiE
MGEEHTGIAEDQLYFFDKQRVVVDDFEAPGFVLDLGGGGEGVIGRLKGDRVIAIDPNRRELEEAPDGPLKIVMDARDLRFLDGAFEVVTSFFTMMYVGEGDHRQVFEEASRVLAPGGRFLIWGAKVPERLDADRDVVVFPLLVELPSAMVETAYGVAWPETSLDVHHYAELARQVGFEVVEQRESGWMFYLSLRNA